MKKYIKIIIPIIVVIVLAVGIFLYLNNNNKLEEGFANLESNNWPELINNEEEISRVSKAFLMATYGENKKVNIESLEVFKPEDEKSYIQLTYGSDVYVVDKLENTVYVLKNDLMDKNIDATIDYNNASTHIEQPNENVMNKFNKIVETYESIYTDYVFTRYTVDTFPVRADAIISNVYVRRDDGFSQFSVAYFNKTKEKTMNLVVLLQNENIIGIAIQIN